jgi:hypothetical protein
MRLACTVQGCEAEEQVDVEGSPKSSKVEPMTLRPHARDSIMHIGTMAHGDTVIAVLIAIESTRGTLISATANGNARRWRCGEKKELQKSCFLRELRVYVRSFSFGMCRQQT